jgi:hypothetical protein
MGMVSGMLWCYGAVMLRCCAVVGECRVLAGGAAVNKAGLGPGVFTNLTSRPP